MASTASSLNFADGTEFSATNPQVPPLLKVSVPIGLQFGSHVERILVQGNGQGRRRTSDLIDTNVGLRVQSNQTLALVGGDVVLEGGTLKTAGGRIELGSVAGLSQVSLAPIEKGWALGYKGVQNFRDIQLSRQTAVDASGAGSGDIQIHGRRVTLADVSEIEASTLRSEPGGTLSVTASELLELSGASADGTASGLFSIVAGGSGAGGNITIETGKLILRDRAAVTASTFGKGRSGDVRIETGQLFVQNGAQIDATTSGEGSAGILAVSASDLVELIGESADGEFPSVLTAETKGTGDAGDLIIETDQLTIRDGAEVTVSSQGAGDAGNLEVLARSVSLDNQGKLVAKSASGQGGNITLQNEDLLLLRRNSAVSATAGTTGTGGDGGNITIDTGLLVALENSDITANAFGGRGGEVQINTQGDFRSLNSDITASSQLGPQFEGVVEINTPDVDLQGSLTQLSVNFVSPEQVVAGSCLARRNEEQGSFVVTGTGGLPRSPYDAISGQFSVTGVRPIQGSAPISSPAVVVEAPIWKTGEPIQEAQGLFVTADGRTIVGTAQQLATVAKAQDLVCSG